MADSRRGNLIRISILGFLFMGTSAAGLAWTHALLSRSPVVIGVQATAVALLVWSRVTFGRRSYHCAAGPTKGDLVTWGPYRFVRHPIYAAACVFCWAGILASLSVASVGFGVLQFVGAMMRIFVEERLLVERYPEYREYAAVTKRMIPYVF